MTRLVHAELLKLRTTRTAVVLAALRQLVLVPAQPLTLAALALGILGMPGSSATAPPPRPSW